MSTFPAAVTAHHASVLGKTGSGKTSTAKLLIEQVVGEDSRVCILDPIKSDWWGITLDRDGRSPGLPFTILGGPHGHLPLHAGSGKALAGVVASGALPLSVMDMADFGPGGHAQFFIDFASTLQRKMKGVLYLVLEEAHLFAPKERSGTGRENEAIHWAKMLATAGRSKGIRLVLATQRVQALHNALLGSCETLIAQRLTLPADQDPVLKWLKANVPDKERMQEIAGSLSSLKTGTGWMCSGEAGTFELVEFPRIRTYDNTATPTGNGAANDVKPPPIDESKLRDLIGDAVKEAESNDTKVLKARIASLEKDLSRSQATERRAVAKVKEVQNELLSAQATQPAEAPAAPALSVFKTRFLKAVGELNAIASQFGAEPTAKTPTLSRSQASCAKAYLDKPQGGPEARILNALAWWESTGMPAPYSKTQVAFIAAYAPGSGAFNNPLGKLRSAGLIEYPMPGTVELTAEGRAAAGPVTAPADTEELQSRILSRLGGPHQKILRILIDAYPEPLSKEELAYRAGYSHGSGAFNNPMGAMRTLGLIDYPRPGHAVALPVLFINEE